MNKQVSNKVDPVFEIDTHSITVCKSHSNYSSISDKYGHDPNPIFQFSPLFLKFTPNSYDSCKTCSHYYNNECYFSKEEIDRITKSHGYAFTLFFNKNTCDICGLKLRNVFNTLRKLYLEEKTSKNFPLICSNCNYNIKHDKIWKKVATVILVNLSLTLPTIIFISLLNINAFLSQNIAFLSVMLGFTVPFGIIVFFLLKRLLKLITYKTKIKDFTQTELIG